MIEKYDDELLEIAQLIEILRKRATEDEREELDAALKDLV